MKNLKKIRQKYKTEIQNSLKILISYIKDNEIEILYRIEDIYTISQFIVNFSKNFDFKYNSVPSKLNGVSGFIIYPYNMKIEKFMHKLIKNLTNKHEE